MGLLYRDYLAQAEAAGLPILVCTPSWRANRDRVNASGIGDAVNGDAVRYMRELSAPWQRRGVKLKLGGMIGCRNDCYRPDEGLPAEEARRFHAWQIGQPADAGVDFLIAETLPNVQEALGIAKAMATAGIPYIISFVISRDGRVLDGSTFVEAFDLIDGHTGRPPLGYMINCAHLLFLCPADQPSKMFARLIGYQANASSLDHCDLDQAEGLETDSVSEWGRLMLSLNVDHGVKVLGGCCGTGVDHLAYLVRHRRISPGGREARCGCPGSGV